MSARRIVPMPVVRGPDPQMVEAGLWATLSSRDPPWVDRGQHKMWKVVWR